MGEDKMWTTVIVPELNAVLWAPSCLSECTDIFFSN